MDLPRTMGAPAENPSDTMKDDCALGAVLKGTASFFAVLPETTVEPTAIDKSDRPGWTGTFKVRNAQMMPGSCSFWPGDRMSIGKSFN